jgi:fucose 4-O-acetylase-like acetyltransferase
MAHRKFAKTEVFLLGSQPRKSNWFLFRQLGKGNLYVLGFRVEFQRVLLAYITNAHVQSVTYVEARSIFVSHSLN